MPCVPKIILAALVTFEKFVSTDQVHTPDMPIFFYQFGSFQINQVLHAAKHLFTIDDMIHNVEIWKYGHAVKVYKVILMFLKMLNQWLMTF